MKKLLIPILFLLSTLTFAQHQVTLTWQTGAGGGVVSGFSVKRATVTGGPYSLVANVPVIQLTYTDISATGNILVEGTTYFYVITATGPGGESGPSNEAKALIPFLPPSAPSNLSTVPK